MVRVLIVDYGMGNLKSVFGAFRRVGCDKIVVSDDPGECKKADKIVIPGVGAFGKAVENLKKKGLWEAILEELPRKSFLGICLGMQILFEESEESEGVRGFSAIRGKVKHLSKISKYMRIPNIGWAETELDEKSPIFKGLGGTEFFYYLHSYYVEPENGNVTIAKFRSEGIKFTSAVSQDNVFAVQFHPEKSGMKGLKIIENFLRF